jgi:ssDNA thymidine ADP-ribosyltransferase, DarT
MDRDEVKELHFITSIDNLASILRRGILCHNRAERIEHRSVASAEVQDRRRGKRVLGGSALHSYANLYFDARNPMMSRLLYDGHDDLIILRVSTAVLDIPETVVTDGNAAATGARFYPSPEGLKYLDSDLIFARSWADERYWPTKEGFWSKEERKRVRCAEVLVPKLIPSEYIEGCYVDTRNKRRECQEFEDLPAVVVYKEVYFQ